MQEKNQKPTHEYYVDLAHRAPRIGPTDTVEQQVSENFFLLFEAVRRVKVDPEGVKRDVSLGFLVARLEKHGDTWKRFLSENQELIQQINEALDGMRPYHELMQHFTDLFREKGEDEAMKFNAEVGHPLGIDAVGIYCSNRLNPLLRKAAEAMERVGIDPKEFH